MRRALVLILTAATLALAACGDDETNVGGEASEGETTPATQTETTSTASEPEAGCKKVDAPEPKAEKKYKKPSKKLDASKSYTAVMETNCGTIEMALDVKRAPKTVASFVSLAREGFYDDL